MKCFRCNQLGHHFNECLQRRQVTIVEGTRDEVEEYYDNEAVDYEEIELVGGDEGEPVICILQKFLLSHCQHTPSQRHAIFWIRCTIQKKVCDVIIDSGSSENIISKSLIKALQLEAEKHLYPYKVGWIKKGMKTKVNEIWKISFSIGKHCQDEVVYDVVQMDDCHILLGPLWQFDVTQGMWQYLYSYLEEQENCPLTHRTQGQQHPHWL